MRQFMRKYKKDGAGRWRKLCCAAFPALCMALLLAGCQQQEQEDSLVLFQEGAYNYKLVYPMQREEWEDAAIVTVYDGLKALCGVAPELVVDTELEETEGSREILIGSTNRAASSMPEMGETDSYWCVIVDEDQVVINGSNEYMIGLAADYFISQWAEEGSEGKISMSTEWTKETLMRDYYREGWLLKEIPAYQGDNTLATELYSSGTYLTEYGTKEATDNRMQSIWETTEEELSSYVGIMESNGYTRESHTSIENNQFYRFTKEEQRVYVNYYGNEGRATVELDDSGRPSAGEVSYTYEPKEGEEAEYYMFGLKMDPNGYSLKQEKNTSGYIDNGACLVIKCADNSVIVIDGGATQQMEKDDRDRFWNFLCEITGTDTNGVVKISVWFITHFDSDHTGGFSAVINANPERYDLQRVICNLPDLEVTSKSDYTAIVSANGAVKKNYPNVREIKLRTGDVLQLADITANVLYTHTDFADAAGRFNTTNFNTTSTVVMFTTSSGMKMLVTGDMMAKAESVLCTNFSGETLKCDIFQQPHHNRADVSAIYEYADAQVIFFTQAVGTLTENATDLARSTLAKQWCSQWYCGGTETVGLKWSGEKAELIYQKQNIYK